MPKAEGLSSLTIVRNAAELRAISDAARAGGGIVGLVPTMGALHRGHLSLLQTARKDCGLLVASLFVNPTQFGDDEDFDSYPRDELHDIVLFERYGVDVVYLPSVGEIYPAGLTITVTVDGLTDGLCGASRPGHFDGVTTVVSKLFEHCRPNAAYFGEKDYQQLKVIERMAKDLKLDIQIVGLPIVRESDGLALSSRNSNLDPNERRMAPELYRTLSVIGEGKLRPDVGLADQCTWGRNKLLEAGFSSVDYFEIRDGATLELANSYRSGLRVFAAAWIGETRLIDNLSIDYLS